MELACKCKRVGTFCQSFVAMKRKGSSGEQTETKGLKRQKRQKKSESDSAKKNGNSKQKTLDELKTNLDLSSPSALISSILKPHTLETFNEEYWEKKPLHIKRENNEFYGNLFSKDSLLKILEDNSLNYEIDLNACKYVDGEKEMMNGEDVAKASDVKDLLDKKGATIQFHQPQRFSDPLWKLMELMEKYFCNHVGANVYITAAGSQGLAPHNDDIEAFVLQLEGQKKWLLYNPLQELSRDYSPDLSPDEIGEKTHEIELKPGDLLYFPRGTIHQAVASSDGISTHLTLSTYQNNCWGDFLLEGITNAVETAISSDIELRKGLPIDYLLKLGTGKFLDEYVDNVDDAAVNGKENGTSDGKENKKPKVEKSPKKISDNTVEKFKAKLKDLLCRVVDHFDPNTVADSRSEDFLANRLPPFEKIPEEEIGKQPTATSSIKLLYPDHMRLVVYEEDDDDEFDADAAEETDEEDIMGDDDDMDEEEDEDTEEEKEEKPATKSKGKGSKGKGKEKANEKSKEKDKDNEKTKGKKKGKKSDSEDDGMEDDAVENDDDDEEEILQGPHMRLLFSVHNPREAHMIGGLPEPNAVKLALHFAKPMKYLLDHCNEFITLKDLPLINEAEKLELATTLWTEKLILVK